MPLHSSPQLLQRFLRFFDGVVVSITQSPWFDGALRPDRQRDISRRSPRRWIGRVDANVADAATAEMLSLESVEVQVALWPLLRRRVEVRSVRLVEPVIELEILSDGTVNPQYCC